MTKATNLAVEFINEIPLMWYHDRKVNPLLSIIKIHPHLILSFFVSLYLPFLDTNVAVAAAFRKSTVHINLIFISFNSFILLFPLKTPSSLSVE